MRLYQLFDGLDVESKPDDREVTGVTADSRRVEPGMVFVCIKGGRFDGHDHAVSALEAGAAAVVCQVPLGLEGEIVCKDTRLAYALLCRNWFGNPGAKLHLIGVTGTNGKTTVTCIIKHILESAGKRAGLIGTIHTEIDDIVIPAKHTTPDPFALQSILARMVKAGCRYAVMECSSHALDQQRLAGLHFDTAVFTNLTQDHLDYHGDMESYFLAKEKLFSMCDSAVVNYDDAYGQRILQRMGGRCVTFSVGGDEADYTAKDIRMEASGSRFMLVGKGCLARVSLPIPGEFSISNAMAAAVACLSAGLSLETVAQGLSDCPGVVGRVEALPTNTDYTVIRDYAHSPDGLEKIITAMRHFAKGRIVTLFGCAGNRDRSKRKLMGEIAARLSDFVILTSDNPRDEDEMQIIEDAMPGIRQHPETPCKVIPDRFDAIQWALRHSQKDDILILAGKGHEDYQVLRGETRCFDERKIVLSLLAESGRKGE